MVSSYDSGNNLHIIQLKEIEPPFPLLEPLPSTQISSIQPASNILSSNVDLFKNGNPPMKDDNTYHNPKLEQEIAKYELRAFVLLSKEHLTDRDMTIVVPQLMIHKQCTALWLQQK